MKKFFFLFTLLLFTKHVSQIKFEPGYIIDDSGKKTEVLIRDLDWLNTPKEFDYKMLGSDKVINGNIKDIKEFGLKNYSYIRETVDIDRSSENFSFLSTTEKPSFTSETLFLKKLIEGKATLYVYKEKNMTRFFYTLNTTTPTQLVYKAYKVDENSVSYNNQYREQIKDDLNCNISESEISKIQYNINALEKIFIKYNQCADGSFVYDKKQNKENHRNWFNITIKPGISQSKFSLNSAQRTDINENFDNEFSFRLGLEFEYVLPFNNGNWTIILEPYFTSYKTSKTGESARIYSPSIIEERSVNYTGIQLPIGMRYYLPIGKKSKLFANASFSLPLYAKTEIDYEFNTDFNSKSASSKLEFGIGYRYFNKLSAELRLHTKQDLISKEANFSSNLQTISLILGYTPF